ncbi:MAG: response regulator [Candidatus Moraniibacteriota bacterium]
METEKGKLVCLIDDDENIRDIYQRKFLQSGFDVVIAKDGEEGLRAIALNHPDIILLDLQMPIMGGMEVLRELKKDEELVKIPVVILSNVDDEVVFSEIGKEYVTKFYLVKSLTTPQKVVSIVREILH